MQIHRFRVKQKITVENEVALIQTLFQDEHVQQSLLVRPLSVSPIIVVSVHAISLGPAPTHKAADPSDVQATLFNCYEHGFL